MITNYDNVSSQDDNPLGGDMQNPQIGGAMPMSPAIPTAPSSNQADSLGDMIIDYNKLAKTPGFPTIYYRQNVIEKMLTVLGTHTHPNILLTGAQGVGKTGIVKQLATDLIASTPNIVNQSLAKNTHIYELSLNNLKSGTEFAGKLESKIKKVIKFASDSQHPVILYIDEIHQLMDDSNSMTSTVMQTLKPALAEGKMRLIGSTTTHEANVFMADPAMKRRFTTVQVDELTDAQTVNIIKNLVPKLTDSITVPDDLLPKIVTLGNEYAKRTQSHRPDTAITLLDQAIAHLTLTWTKVNLTTQNISPATKRVLTEKHVAQTVTALFGIKPWNTINIAKLTTQLDDTLIGQTTAKTALIDAIKRQNLQLTKPKIPASYLLAGPTGTGKSEIAKQLTLALFGNLSHLITINMTEYATENAISKLTGTSAGYIGYDVKRSLPLDPVRNDPYQVILLDEFEKAHPLVKRWFMQVLDEGHIDDSRGIEYDFSHCIVIATTNAGVEQLSQKANPVGFGTADTPHFTHNDIIDALKRDFPIELLNRFKHTIVFDALSLADYTQVLKLKINQFVQTITTQRYTFTPNQLDLATDYAPITKLANQTYNPQFNGRPAKELAEKFVTDRILATPATTWPTSINLIN